MLKWPSRAGAALVRLFAPLQDVDVYVEDNNDEVFYTELFKKIAPDDIRIVRVFALGNRDNVIQKAIGHDPSKRRALFLIDGDFEWVRGEPIVAMTHLHRLEAYCIENLLIDEHSAVQIVIEEGALAECAAKEKLDFAAWINGITAPLVDLFIAFAVSNLLTPSHPTVAAGLSGLLKPCVGAPPELDEGNVRAITAAVIARTVAEVGQAAVDSEEAKIRARVKALPRPIDIVSGKNVLLPLMHFRLQTVAQCRAPRKSLRVRLARHCNPAQVSPIKAALTRVAK